MECKEFVRSFIYFYSSECTSQLSYAISNNFPIIEDIITKVNGIDDEERELVLKSQMDILIDVTCQENISWGKILSILIYVSYLYSKSQEKNQLQTGENIIQWTSEHFETYRFRIWIDNHGGWGKMSTLTLQSDNEISFIKKTKELWEMLKLKFNIHSVFSYIMRLFL